jgi:hypothetical protein
VSANPRSADPPPERPPGERDPTRGPAKVIARYLDGRVIKGYCYDFSPDAPRFRLYPLGGQAKRGAIEAGVLDLKAVFFVRDFVGNPAYAERKAFAGGERPPGRKVTVIFTDGEVLTGYTLGYDRQRPGFFLFPADPRSNNLRVFVVSAAVRDVRSDG